MSNAASSDKDKSKSGSNFAGCLKKEHVAYTTSDMKQAMLELVLSINN